MDNMPHLFFIVVTRISHEILFLCKIIVVCLVMQRQIQTHLGEATTLWRELATHQQQMAAQQQQLVDTNVRITLLENHVRDLQVENGLRADNNSLVTGQLIYTFCDLLIEWLEDGDRDDYYGEDYSAIKARIQIDDPALFNYFPTAEVLPDRVGDRIFNRCRAIRRGVAHPDLFQYDQRDLEVIIQRRLGNLGNQGVHLLRAAVNLREALDLRP
uniref:Uncharacterized protein n=1 Tax=Vannella robusta TaxID=1487602 RepID=A0A7S4HRD3_9EUKA|mmetsp:Transcript_14694/g.18603  ORF Transcript_14694/g.18603 Transcript_14694/m.18603 type:complete len:214 (+) Transcript_14694:61-702(+)